MQLVFIAGPYFGDGKYETIERNIQDAEKVAIELANRQVPFFCAHLHTRHFEVKAEAPESFYHALDAAMLERAANAVVALPRWRESGGARREIAWAEANSVRVFYLRSLDDAETLEAIAHWAKKGAKEK